MFLSYYKGILDFANTSLLLQGSYYYLYYSYYLYYIILLYSLWGFASVFNNTGGPWDAQAPSFRQAWEQWLSICGCKIVRDQLYWLNVHRYMWPDGIHPRALKELADVMAGSHSVICQGSWESEQSLLTECQPMLFLSIKRLWGKMQETTPSLTSVLGKNIEIIILGDIERYL